MTAPIEVPPSLPAEVRGPGGDASGADVLASALHAAAARFEEVADAADLLQGVGCCCGTDRDAHVEQAGSVSARHEAMARTVEGVGRAVSAYADTLRDLTRDWGEQVDRKAALDERRRSLLADLEAAGAPGSDDLHDLRLRSEDLRSAYGELVADHDALQGRAQDGEEQLRQAFQAGTLLGEALAHVDGVAQVRRTAQAALARLGADGAGGSPIEVEAWWDGLGEAERTAVAATYPDLIGADGGGSRSVRVSHGVRPPSHGD